MGEWTDKVEGKTKEAAGTVTRDDSMRDEGKAQSTWGNVEGKANDVKHSVSDAADEIGDKVGGSRDTANEDRD